ncbi:hydrogenase expression/formation protein [Novosphingobium pituita]|uniref:Hydrogenase expression/formation protein n=1 Tax=Novosphingobium pituita TaxID=3056842 RepID=A0ABQ6P293_9SPHN|nr:hydrogenase expression/formation protein [Novosphingobium sp. IK01]GMM59372.1 hydrogenase expression/formation protein [Novosphingobium sp. IK01]
MSGISDMPEMGDLMGGGMPGASDGLMGAFVGPGSQPADADGATLDYMIMPDDMRVFSMATIPDSDLADEHAAGVAAGAAILAALEQVVAGGAPASVDLSHLAPADMAFVDQMLGEGEVSVISGSTFQAQESVLAGVWRVRETGADGAGRRDRVDIGMFPAGIVERAFERARDEAVMPDKVIEGVFNAPALIAEINAHAPATPTREGPHVINLSLLPHTEGDLAFLEAALGQGDLIILSRGYGNCRIRSTGTRHGWWVRYFNSQDSLILNSIELTSLPSVAQAAPEDLADSAERLSEILATYQ